jgi:hypothetical protein
MGNTTGSVLLWQCYGAASIVCPRSVVTTESLCSGGYLSTRRGLEWAPGFTTGAPGLGSYGRRYSAQNL